MKRGFHPRKQGDIGEAHAIAWLTEIGATVWVPLFHSPDVDVIAELNGRLQRVQVKTSGVRRSDRYAVHIATNGGNRSWTGAVKHFSQERCDFLYAYVLDGRAWFIPSSAVCAATSITVGGPKYSEYEIGPDRTIPAAALEHLECAPPRGSAVVGETGWSVKSVPSAEWVRIPPPPSKAQPAAMDLQPVKLRHVGRARMSSGHQMTVPIGPFRAAGLAPGDEFEVTALGPGEFKVRRVHAAYVPAPAQPELTTPAEPEPGEAA